MGPSARLGCAFAPVRPRCSGGFSEVSEEAGQACLTDFTAAQCVLPARRHQLTQSRLLRRGLGYRRTSPGAR